MASRLPIPPKPLLCAVFAVIALSVSTALACVACGSSKAVYRTPWGERIRFRDVGTASWYGPGFAGRLTASGEVFDPSQLTAAHGSLPMGTHVRVTALDSGRSVVVRVNDHFPGTRGRIIDLSEASFAALAPTQRGLLQVRLEVVPGPPPPARLPLEAY